MEEKYLTLNEFKNRWGFTSDKDFFTVIWSGSEMPQPFYKLSDIEEFEEKNKRGMIGMPTIPEEHERLFIRNIQDAKSELEKAERNFEQLYGRKAPL
jgi:glutaredoxin-related protein